MSKIVFINRYKLFRKFILNPLKFNTKINNYKLLKYIVERLPRTIRYKKNLLYRRRFMYSFGNHEIFIKKEKRKSYKWLFSIQYYNLNLFYGNLGSEYFFKNLVRKARLSKKIMYKNNLIAFFFERKLNIILYRSGFTYSILHSKQLIKHGYILVNGKKVTYPNYNLKLFDKVSLERSYKWFIFKYLKFLLKNLFLKRRIRFKAFKYRKKCSYNFKKFQNTFFFYFYKFNSKYLYINYNGMFLFFYKYPTIKNLRFPFKAFFWRGIIK